MINIGYGISILKSIWDTILEAPTASSFVVNLSRSLWTDEEMSQGCLKFKASLKKSSREAERKILCRHKMKIIRCKLSLNRLS